MPRGRPARRPSRRGRLWTRIKRALGFGSAPEPPPPEWPPEEPALVPAGPPRRPRPSGAVALELPEEQRDTDAYGGERS